LLTNNLIVKIDSNNIILYKIKKIENLYYLCILQTREMSFQQNCEKKGMVGKMTNTGGKQGMEKKIARGEKIADSEQALNEQRRIFMKTFPQKLRVWMKNTETFPAGCAIIGSSLGNAAAADTKAIAKGANVPDVSDIDIVVGALPEYPQKNLEKYVSTELGHDIKTQLQGSIFSDPVVTPITLSTPYTGDGKSDTQEVVRLVVKTYLKINRYDPSLGGQTISSTEVVIGVVDIVFHSISDLPSPLFTKGGLMNIVQKLSGRNVSLSSRLPDRTCSDILAEFKNKETSLVRQRVEELLPKQKNYLLKKIVWLLLRGWKIRNCSLQCEIPQHLLKLVFSAWLGISETAEKKDHMVDILSPHVKFFVDSHGKQTQVSFAHVFSGQMMDTDGFFCLPDGKRVPAFSWQKDWTKKLVMTCVICKDDLDGTKSFWRTSKCSHVVCEDCHGRARELGRASFDDGDDNSCVSRHDFSKVCSTCKHTLFKQEV
jgi:hypothetical protein